MTDPIADMLTRIRNGLAYKKVKVSVPFSNFKLSIANVLKKHDWINDVEVVEVDSPNKANSNMFKEIDIVLKYQKNGEPVIRNLKRVSRPGRRVYKKGEEIKKIKSGYGMSIISTSDGVMAGHKAYKEGKGGEIICKIW
ncbi:MAG TPA: 30S ribosomal protein S8 [Patescibacteria group bacterium]|nr:30S ribosomal protein S8 [Patescibacteria group bacterium]